MFHVGDLSHHLLPPSLFLSRCTPPLAKFQVSTQVLTLVFPPRMDLNIVDTFAYSRVTSEHFYPPRFGSHVCSNGGTRLPREAISLRWDVSPLPVDAVGKLALSTSTISRINQGHVETPIDVRTLQSARQVTAVVTYPTGSPGLGQSLILHHQLSACHEVDSPAPTKNNSTLLRVFKDAFGRI